MAIFLVNDVKVLISKFNSQNNDKEYSRASVLDAIGTVAVEASSKHIRNLVCLEAKDKNFRTTRHFSPGYEDWDINQQKEIFKIITASPFSGGSIPTGKPWKNR